MSTVNFDMSELKQFFQQMENAARGKFKEDFTVWLEAIGFDFLRVVQDEIKNRKVIDSRLLLDSFTKNDRGNIWRMLNSGLTLEVGTNVLYATWVEYGHTQKPGRFVPGYWEGGTFKEEKIENGKIIPAHWEGGKFIYDPSAESGMVLKAEKVDGKHYFKNSFDKYKTTFETSAERKLQQWINDYFTV